jgi:hypothetical protein
VKLLDVNANGIDKDSLNRGLNDLKRKERTTPYLEKRRKYMKIWKIVSA